jgi:hypothetical protein
MPAALMTRPDPEAALERYLHHLRACNLPTKRLTLAQHFLRHLLSTLKHEAAADGADYRRAAENTLRNFPDPEQFLDIIREFFPYWSGEPAPATTTPRAGAALPLERPVQTPVKTLIDAMRQLEQDPWSKVSLAALERQVHQLRALARYAEAMRERGVDPGEADRRMRLMRLLLYIIRDQPQNTEHYRQGVDAVLALVPDQSQWPAFVALAREFFYFLANEPNAAARIQTHIPLDGLGTLLNPTGGT